MDYYTAEAVRALERVAIEQHGITGFTLMQRAGQAAFSALQQRWSTCRRLVVVCGTGNNGGDGFVIAALAKQQGFAVEVVLIGARQSIKGDALLALQLAERLGVNIAPAEALAARLRDAAQGVIVDALLGTGLSGEVRMPQRVAIDMINASALPVLAVDIPSGLCSDTGKALGAAVNASLTVTFIGRKRGLVEGDGPLHAGEIHFADLGVPQAAYAAVRPALAQPDTNAHS